MGCSGETGSTQQTCLQVQNFSKIFIKWARAQAKGQTQMKLLQSALQPVWPPETPCLNWPQAPQPGVDGDLVPAQLPQGSAMVLGLGHLADAGRQWAGHWLAVHEVCSRPVCSKSQDTGNVDENLLPVKWHRWLSLQPYSFPAITSLVRLATWLQATLLNNALYEQWMLAQGHILEERLL